MDRRGHVARERPRRGGPDQEVLPVMAGAGDRQPQGERQVADLVVALRRDLHVGEPGAAARAPGHHVVALVDEPPLVALLQEGPDRVVVLVAVGEVAVLPVHPHAEPLALLGLKRGEGVNPRLAQLHEAIDPERLDLAFVVEAELLLDLDLDPQPLAVESVLVALPLAEHGVVALVEILVGATPRVVHAHRVIGRDRAVEEAPAPLGRGVARQVALHRPAFAPDRDLLPLDGGDIQLARHRLEHGHSTQ